MKHISLDRENEQIKKFICALSVEAEGSILELGGKPVVTVLPATKRPVDRAKLKAAILRRRDESRRLNEDWQAVDREMWDRIPPPEET